MSSFYTSSCYKTIVLSACGVAAGDLYCQLYCIPLYSDSGINEFSTVFDLFGIFLCLLYLVNLGAHRRSQSFEALIMVSQIMLVFTLFAHI